MAQKRVAVAGATGYIGGRLVPRLLADGHRARCLVRSPGKRLGEAAVLPAGNGNATPSGTQSPHEAAAEPPLNQPYAIYAGKLAANKGSRF